MPANSRWDLIRASKGLLLTPWSRVLLEKLTSKLCSQSRNSLHLWNPKVPHRTHKCPPLVPILSQLHPVPMTPSNFLKIHLNIILPSTSWSPQWPLSLSLPHQHPVHNSILTHTSHTPCPSHSSRFTNAQYWLRCTDHSSHRYAGIFPFYTFYKSSLLR